MKEVQILATGSYVPDRIVTNDELSTVMDTNDEWIKTRTGICERRITTGENTSSIAAKAALKALESSYIKPVDLDLIIVATATPDCYTPSTACIVQDIIGATNATCFDISAACSGFIYGLNIAYQFIKNGAKKNVLVIGAETLSKILDWNNRSTCVLFGDGAGAAILGCGEEKGLIEIHTGSDGRGANLLKCNAASVDINNKDLKEKIYGNTEDVDKSYLTMEGREIFKFAVKAMGETIDTLLNSSELTIEDIKYIVPHQANLRIIDYMIKKLKVDSKKFYTNLQYYGNTSAASIPIAMDQMNREGLLEKGDKILLVGFGGGLTWGGTIIEWTINKNK
ncbi:beta-ketoacyl-ACP synthase III [Clostridium lundense]|uniref:beta-ketoacyl-ACP synthase III n=1 Tax=Clostridium lundense TaxID=319475 RepID=UPI000481368F|nr:beta-ketoacyl-ACP synthase III [Clostridium lundense]